MSKSTRAGKSAGDSVFVYLACGHYKHCKASDEPKHFAFCDECLTTAWSSSVVGLEGGVS